MSRQTARTIVSIIACGWPLIPVVGTVIRGTAHWILVDSVIGVIESGVLLLLVAVIHWRSTCRISDNGGEGDDLLSPKRIALAGLIMLGFWAVGLLAEIYLLGT